MRPERNTLTPCPVELVAHGEGEDIVANAQPPSATSSMRTMALDQSPGATPPAPPTASIDGDGVDRRGLASVPEATEPRRPPAAVTRRDSAGGVG